MPVEQFYTPPKRRYDEFFIRANEDFCFPGSDRRRADAFYQRLLNMWIMPDACTAEVRERQEDVCTRIQWVSAKATEKSESISRAAGLEQAFLQHAAIWDEETAHLSSTPKKVLHDSYQNIMALGPDVVPLLLRDLETNHRSWFWALRHLTHANPVSPEDQGNLDKMITAWVEWGKREGII
jgi:hypothetical protein